MKVKDIIINKRNMIIPYLIKYSKLNIRWLIYETFNYFSVDIFEIHKKEILKKLNKKKMNV